MCLHSFGVDLCFYKEAPQNAWLKGLREWRRGQVNLKDKAKMYMN